MDWICWFGLGFGEGCLIIRIEGIGLLFCWRRCPIRCLLCRLKALEAGIVFVCLGLMKLVSYALIQEIRFLYHLIQKLNALFHLKLKIHL